MKYLHPYLQSKKRRNVGKRGKFSLHKQHQQTTCLGEEQKFFYEFSSRAYDDN